jgi:hypothetical protein
MQKDSGGEGRVIIIRVSGVRVPPPLPNKIAELARLQFLEPGFFVARVSA